MQIKRRPFLKWAGGKFKLVDILKTYLPTANRYFEPFLGAGSLALNVDYPQMIVNDVNPHLIWVWRHLQSDPVNFIEVARSYFTAENNAEERFYDLRAEFNQTNDPLTKSALFIYLNRHDFNGLCRFNGKGEFNVPFGRYKTPVYFPYDELIACSDHLLKFEIRNDGFEQLLEEVGEGDVVYCDPPYVPLSITSSFTSYSKDNFGIEKQQILANLAISAASRGATIVISNSDTEITRSLYQKASLTQIDASRVIGGNRKPVQELIAVFNNV